MNYKEIDNKELNKVNGGIDNNIVENIYKGDIFKNTLFVYE